MTKTEVMIFDIIKVGGGIIRHFFQTCAAPSYNVCEIREIMNNSYMHQCTKETSLQGFDYGLCLWMQIKGIIFKSRTIDKEMETEE